MSIQYSFLNTHSSFIKFTKLSQVSGSNVQYKSKRLKPKPWRSSFMNTGHERSDKCLHTSSDCTSSIRYRILLNSFQNESLILNEILCRNVEGFSEIKLQCNSVLHCKLKTHFLYVARVHLSHLLLATSLLLPHGSAM